MKTAKHQYLIKIWLVKNIHIQLHQWFISTLCISFAVTYCRNHFCSRFIDVVYTAQSSPSLCQITSSFQYSYSKGSETLSAFIILRLQSTVINQWNQQEREKHSEMLLRMRTQGRGLDNAFKMLRMTSAALWSYSSQFMSVGSSYEE